MTALPVLHGEVSFEISLPHIVWVFLFKALIRRGVLTVLFIDQAVSPKNIVEGACARKVLITFILHHTADFHCADRGVIISVFYNLLLQLGRDLVCGLKRRFAFVL